mgnify:CR=1 FL=1
MKRQAARLVPAVALLALGVATFVPHLKGQNTGQPSTKNGEWPMYTADLSGSKYSPLDQIGASNFSKLEVAWRFKTDNLGPRPENKLEGTRPVVANQAAASKPADAASDEEDATPRSAKGKVGDVLRVLPAESRVVVSGVNVIKRHTKPGRTDQGGIIEREAAIHVSNVALLDPKSDKPTKVGFKFLDDGRKVRFARASGETIDR